MTLANNGFSLWRTQGEQEATDERSLCHCDQSRKFEFSVVLLIEIALTLDSFFWVEREILLA